MLVVASPSDSRSTPVSPETWLRSPKFKKTWISFLKCSSVNLHVNREMCNAWYIPAKGPNNRCSYKAPDPSGQSAGKSLSLSLIMGYLPSATLSCLRLGRVAYSPLHPPKHCQTQETVGAQSLLLWGCPEAVMVCTAIALFRGGLHLLYAPPISLLFDCYHAFHLAAKQNNEEVYFLSILT